ncbi:MAG: hypothetical protein ABIP51_16010 [Bacteroidia bacterium]
MQKVWNNLSVETFQEISLLNKSDFKNESAYRFKIISIVYDLDIEEIEELDYLEILNKLKEISDIKNLSKKEPKSILKTTAGELCLIDLYKITIGEFIDLEFLFIDGYIKNILPILATLYRVKTSSKSLLYPDSIEPYGNYIQHREPLFKQTRISDVYGVVNRYLEFRKMIFDTYDLFEESKTPEPIDENLDAITRSEIAQEDAQNERVKLWGWQILLLRLANNDPTKLEAATNIPLIQALNLLLMKKEMKIPD